LIQLLELCRRFVHLYHRHLYHQLILKMNDHLNHHHRELQMNL
jgi:hypothetical protein